MSPFADRRRPDREPEVTPLEVPLPPDAARLFGYPGDARLVAFHWEPAGDEVVYDDGRLSGTGESFVFLTYRRHPAVAPHLEPYNLGYSDREAEHRLVIDTEEGRAGVATAADARALIRDQHPPPPELSPYELEEARRFLEEAFSEGWREVRVDPEEVRQGMAAQRRAIAEMVEYLDRFHPGG
jgi:hypothetical protein